MSLLWMTNQRVVLSTATNMHIHIVSPIMTKIYDIFEILLGLK